uniref:CHAT domain-containing protein n=1 Tax=Candidatus Kentrum sp. TUN TaxID=2126343 RepID=A0A451A585_9GAMM|nr:MAG: hypothetical protein BECKTUN1418D_GA0071000_11465 [Candidatus Kentron sp. TUN]
MSMQKQVVLVRPRHRDDDITTHTHAWSEEIKRLFEENDWTVTDCTTEKATREFVEKVLTAQPDSLFVFYGHGDEDALIGQDRSEVCDFRNVKLLGKRKIYAMACSSAKKGGLGDRAVNEYGALVYFGYIGRVKGYWSERDSQHGDMMDALEQCVNSGMQTWIVQPELTAAEVKRKMLTVYDYWILYYGSPNSPVTKEKPWAHTIARKLAHNRKALEYTGR